MEEIIQTAAQQDSAQQNKTPLQIHIENREKEWLIKISKLNEQLKTLEGIRDLQTVIVTERQIAVDYYYKVLRMLSTLNKEYRPKYADMYDYFKTKTDIRLNSDQAITAHVQGKLASSIMDIELMNNHAKYMQETIKSIDDIIYAIQNRLQLEKLIKGYDV